MEPKTQWRILLIVIFSFLLLIPVGTLIYLFPNNFFEAIIRLAALWGFIGLILSAIMNLNKKILYQKFGLKFMQLHHFMAIFSLITATVHPVVFAIQQVNLLVFIPDFSSWYNFWSLGGRPALILIYIALIAALLRKKSKNAWKYIHWLNYLALILIFIHAILIGTDFQTILILCVFSVLVLGVFLTFVYLRSLVLKKWLEKRNEEVENSSK
jgi:predicted ferric reductase